MRKLNLLAGIVATFSTANVVQAELLSFYEFNVVNEAAPQLVLDSTGNGNHGIMRGLPDGSPGRPSILEGSGVTGAAADGSVGFDANGDIYLPTVNNGPEPGAFQSIIDTQVMSIAFWSKPPAAEAHQNTFWGWLDPGRSSSVASWSNNNIFWDTGGCCGPTQRLNGAIEPPDGEWHHWAFTHNDFGDKVIYLDGEFYLEALDQNAEILGPSEEAPSEYFIGSERGTINYMVGEIDDYAVWDEVISEADIAMIFDSGVRSVVSGLPDEPDQYVPGTTPTARLVNLDGKLGGAAFAENGEVVSWRVEELFTTSAGGQEIVAIADLATAGVSGDGAIGDATTDEQLGDVDLVNEGADDLTRTFRLFATTEDPLLGSAETSFVEMITIPGSGVGSIDPFVLEGDLNQDDEIGFADFLILSANFGATKEPLAGLQVPEPASLSLLCMASVAFSLIRRRRR